MAHKDAKHFKAPSRDAGQASLDTYVSQTRDGILRRLCMLVSAQDGRPLSWAESSAVQTLLRETSKPGKQIFEGLSHQTLMKEAEDYWMFEVDIESIYLNTEGVCSPLR